MSGGIEDEDDVPKLVDPPSDSDDESYFLPATKKYRKVPGNFPWRSDTTCLQSNFSNQATRWMKLDEESRKSTFGAVKRLLVTPFLFQQHVIPEKWLRWAKFKDMIAFDISKRELPAGKISRQHYLVVKMFDCSLEKLKTLIDKKKTVAAIMKMMYSIRNVSVADVDKAIRDTKANENLKIIVDFIKSELTGYSKSDRDFFEAVDRISLTALLCMRQFAEVIHIVTCEERDIGIEVKNQLTNHSYYLLEDHNIGREKGNKFFKDGKYQDAINAYTEAINNAPFHYLLYSNRCQASIRMCDYESAFSDAYRTIVLNPSWGKGYYKVILCLGELGYVEEALDWGKQALERDIDEFTAKSLKDLMQHITSKKRPEEDAALPKEPEAAVASENAPAEKKNRKTKRKKKAKVKKEDDDLSVNVPELVSDDEFDECPVIVDKAKKDEEAEKRKEEQRKKDEKERKKREEKDKKERATLDEFEQHLRKAAAEFLKSRYADACKDYALSIIFAEKHKEIRGYTDNDFATLLYTRGVVSQRQGSAIEIDASRQFFNRIINEHKMFSHLGMAYYANAKSTYLLNNFEQAKKEVSTALQMVKKFPMHGKLTWPGSSENIPESDESYLRKEIHVLLQQCKVPPIPSAMCQYDACLKDYTRKQIYITDLNFEGFFEVWCDWHCVLSFHLRCWAKFKHDHLNLSGDKDVLGMPCFTPDCQGKIMLIRMLDEFALEKKIVKSSEERKKSHAKAKTENSHQRMSKSEKNLKKYYEKLEEKKLRKHEHTAAKEIDPSATKDFKDGNHKSSESDCTPDYRDLSEATIYVKNDNSQKANRNFHGRGGRRVVPASLHQYCSSLPGYSKNMSVKLLGETIERAKRDGISLTLPDDLQEEIEQVALHLRDDNVPVVFTSDEKIKIPFLLEHFMNFFTENGPLNTTSSIFTEQLVILPKDMRNIIGKCGGLVAFLNASPLFIQVPPYIGVHSQHQDMKKLTEVPHERNHVVISQNSPIDLAPFMEFEDTGLSQFAQEFYQVGANVEDIDILNLTCAVTDSAQSYSQGRMYELDEVPVQKRLKNSQNSETSSMYSLDDVTEMKSELNSQASFDGEKSMAATAGPHTPQKHQPQTIIPPQLKKPMPKKKLSTTATQTENRDEAEKAKEAVARLQERLKEMQDDYTKLKRTSQSREESLVKDLEASKERERVAFKESESIRQTAESEMAKIPQYKKQVQVAESKLEQSRTRERDLESNLTSLTAGMQQEREGHLQEILALRKAVEIKEKDIVAIRRRAVAAEIDIMKTKEAYHVGAHMQAKTHCEQGVREFDVELVRLSALLPDHIINHFKLARKEWVDSVISCGKTIETLKAAYSSIIDQINAGRPLSELPPVPDLKPASPGPNPRHMMIQLQRSGVVNAVPKPPQPINGSGDGKMHGIVNQPVNGTNSPVPGASAPKMNPSPLPQVTKARDPAPMPPPSVPPQRPIGSELPKPPRKKNFLQLVEKLSKNLPQLSREQLEECAQRVRAENKGLTGLLYEEIEKRIREMAGLGIAEQPHNPGPSIRQSTPASSIWKIGPTVFNSREGGDFWELEDEAVCPICCDPLKDGRIHTLECQHKFHYDCINKWMQKQRTCPNCRKFMADTTEFPSLGGPAPPGLLRNRN